MPRLRCLKPPIQLGVTIVLAKVGDVIEIADPLPHWWEAQVLRGNVEIVEPAVEPVVEPEPTAEKPKAKSKKAKRN
jgi:hypothetical protein